MGRLRIAVAICALVTVTNTSKVTAAEPVANDHRVRIISPHPGQVFTPGQTVEVVLDIDRSIQPIKGLVGGQTEQMLGVPFVALDEKILRTDPVKVSLLIPDNVAGEVRLTAAVRNATQTLFESAPVTIAVRPAETPLRLVVDDLLMFELSQPPNSLNRIGVTGVYAGGVERDLSAAAAGTVYRCSNPSVAAVDAEGNVTALTPGTAVVTVEHNGVKAFTIVEVSNHDQPPPTPEDVTATLKIERGEIRESRQFIFVEEVRLTNTGEIPIVGPTVRGAAESSSRC